MSNWVRSIRLAPRSSAGDGNPALTRFLSSSTSSGTSEMGIGRRLETTLIICTVYAVARLHDNSQQARCPMFEHSSPSHSGNGLPDLSCVLSTGLVPLIGDKSCATMSATLTL